MVSQVADVFQNRHNGSKSSDVHLLCRMPQQPVLHPHLGFQHEGFMLQQRHIILLGLMQQTVRKKHLIDCNSSVRSINNTSMAELIQM